MQGHLLSYLIYLLHMGCVPLAGRSISKTPSEKGFQIKYYKLLVDFSHIFFFCQVMEKLIVEWIQKYFDDNSL